MSQFTGKNIGAEVASGANEPEGDRSWATFTVSDALLGEQAFSVSKADALHLGQLFIGETVDPNAEFTSDHADAFAELFRQFAGTVAVQLKEILGKECVVRFKDTQMPSWNSVETASMTMTTEPPVAVTLHMDTGLLNSITKIRVAASEPEPQEAMAEPVKTEAAIFQAAEPEEAQAAEYEEPAPSVSNEGAHSRTPINDRNLDLLLDVELDVSMRFGRRQMLLKDVLDLSSGAMVELDRRVRDPIELLLGGRVIARGEAVIVDGHYGIRITEIVSRSQRLAEIG